MRLRPEKVERLQTKLYEKAKREPGFRFYSLYDKVCWAETLSQAYQKAKANRGAPGVDGVTFNDIEADGLEEWLGELRKELVEERYRPHPVRRVKIPKPGGGERPLGIPVIRDRVVQGAVMLFLEPIFEADFEANAYAYRLGRGAHDALRDVQEGLWSGKVHVVDADLSRYFDTIPHSDLLRSVARRVADGKILRLIKLWLKSPVQELDGSGRWRRTGGKKSRRGVPQGGVISPLLANLYMNRYLRHWRRTGASQRLGEIVNYADDFVILCATRDQAETSLAQTERWMEKLGLAVHPSKTRLVNARQESFDFLGYTYGVSWRHDKRRWVLGARPSKTAQMRLKRKIDTLLYRGNPLPWPELCRRLNWLLVGWANYFSYGATGGAYQAIWRHTAVRVRHFLCKRHKLRTRGASRFGWREVYGDLGVVDLCQYRLRRRTVHAYS